MKGKEAAQAARRRVTELEATLAEERQAATAARQAANVREAELRAEIARLSGALDRDVKHLADARVREAEDRITAAWHAEREARDERLRKALRYLQTEDFRVARGALARFTEMLGVPVNAMFTNLEHASRNVRRAKASDSNTEDNVPNWIGGDPFTHKQRETRDQMLAGEIPLVPEDCYQPGEASA